VSSKASRRMRRQKLKEKYAKTREEAQLAGLIPMTPEGAVRNEKVDPALQGAALLPELVRLALRNNWSTPDIAKPAIVANLLEPFFTREVGPDGVLLPPNRTQLIELAKVLKLLDQTQYERDHPESKGGSISISLQNTLLATEVMRKSLEAVDVKVATDHIMSVTEKCFR